MARLHERKAYHGKRLPDGTLSVRVYFNDHGNSSRSLPKRLDLSNHSPTGFECGYAGSGPAQLALAILADATREDDTALRFHQKFKFEVIARLPRDQDWELPVECVHDFIAGTT